MLIGQLCCPLIMVLAVAARIRPNFGQALGPMWYYTPKTLADRRRRTGVSQNKRAQPPAAPFIPAIESVGKSVAFTPPAHG